MQVQRINENFNIKNQPSFGMRVSKLGRQIDEVLINKGTESQSVEKLHSMLNDYFEHDYDKTKLIGEGFHEKVCSVDDKYVLKFHQNTIPNPGAFIFNPSKVGNALTGLKTYFGKILMQFGDIKILRNVSSDGRHIPVGIPRRMVGEFPYEELIAYYNNIYLPIFSNLPQHSFDRIAKDFACLNSKCRGVQGYEFDTKNPNNIVLAGASSLRIVDDINIVPRFKPNSVAGLLDMFLKKAATNMFAPQTLENKPLRFQLFKKIIFAGEKYELPFESGNVYDDTWNKVCDFGKNGTETRRGLELIRESVKDKTERLRLVNDYLNE